MSMESSHNAAELGELTASGNPPIKLASLADLVRQAMRIDGPPFLPVRVAAGRVMDVLEGADPLPDLYLTNPADFAAPVAADYLVRKGRTATKANVDVVPSRTAWASNWGQTSAGHRFVSKPAVAAVSERRGVAGLLAKLREAWAQKANSPDALNVPRYARLAMRDDVAQALFSLAHVSGAGDPKPAGAAASTLQAPAQFVSPSGLPTGLLNRPPHDAKRWGSSMSNEVPPRRLVRVADLVRMTCTNTGVDSVRWCAAAVLEELTTGVPLLLFVLQRGPLARPVTDADPWRPRFASGPEHLAEWQDGERFFCRPLWSLSDDELTARGITFPDGYSHGMVPADLEPLQALPELLGPAGALELLQVQWVDRAETFDDLDTGALAALAILEADAVRLFGQVPPAVATAPEPSPVPASLASESTLLETVRPAALALVSSAPTLPGRDAQARKDLEAKARAEFKRAKDPADLWESQHFAELLQQFNVLTAKVPGRLNAQPAHDLLSEIWGIQPASVKTYLTKARALLQHADSRAAV